MSVLKEAESLKSYMVGLRNYFHAHPELGLQEFGTCRKIEEELDGIGLEHFRVKETNVIARIDSGRPGRTLVLRADIDALPIQEANDVPYKSQNPGVMHACGHDGHTAYLLGAARIINAHRDDFCGKVILVFQAAEEIGKGARDVIDAGVLDGADRCFGIHFSSGIDVGKVSVKAGADMASCDRFRITVHGKSAHITCPQLGVDSVFVASLIVTQLQTLVPRLVSPVEGALIGVGRIASGTTYNIIPEEAEIEGTIRTFSKAVREKLSEAVRKVARNVADEYGATADIQIEDICDPCFNDAQSAEEVVRSAQKIFGGENVLTTIEKRFGSDNFADFYRKVPGCYVHVGSADSERTRIAHHNDHFDLAEDSCTFAAALTSQYALDFLAQQ